MNHSPIPGIAAQGPLPAGMLRIQQGSQERYVWPVHLPGWLALGWRVTGADVTPAFPDALDLGPESPAIETEPDPAPTRGKRGRRRKEADEAAATAAVEPTDAAAAAPLPEASESQSRFEALPLSGLPDDLFDDSLI
jgi:hypothetical protein